MTAALNQVVTTTDTMVNWGLKFFGSSNACAVTAPPEVPIGPMNGRGDRGGDRPHHDRQPDAHAHTASTPAPPTWRR